MAIAFRAASTATIGSGSSLAVTKPAGTASGDILVAICWQDSDGNASSGSLTAPSGWTQTGATIASSSTSPFGKVFYKVAGSAEPTSYSFGLAANSSAAFTILAFSGGNTASPIAVAPAAGTGSGTSQVAPSITGSAGDELICSWAGQSGSLTWSVASGMTERADVTSSWVGSAVDTQDLAASGATGTKTATSSASPSGNWRSVTLSISGSVAYTGSANATIRLAASRAGVARRAGAPTATVRLAAASSATQTRRGSSTAALRVAASVAAGRVAASSPAAAAIRISASATGNQVNIGRAVIRLAASMASPRHTGAVAVTATVRLAATTGARVHTGAVTVAAILRLAAQTSAGSARWAPVSAAPLFLAATTDTSRIVAEVAAELRPKPSKQVVYELVCVARVPQPSGAPLLFEVDPIDWTGLSYTEELSKPPTLQAGCTVSGLTEPVLQRLRDLAGLGTEVWLYRNGKLVFAGPWRGWQVQGETLTITAQGLLGYLRNMVVASDQVFANTDQFTIAKTLIDQWQNLPYGNFGIDTSGVGVSGVLRDATYLAKELHNVGQRVEELGLRDNGFDVTVDPASRKLLLGYPIRGVDRSTGEDAIIFDERNVTSTNVTCSAAPEDLASEAYGTGTGGSTLFSTQTNTALRASYGRSAVTASFDGVTEQTTLDAHTLGLLEARNQALLIPGPDVRVTPDADVASWDVGDTVSYTLHSRLSVAGAFRLRSRTVTVSPTGQESVSVQFV